MPKPLPLPSSFKPSLLTPADLDNHPMAKFYILYLNSGIRYPLDFQAWLDRENKDPDVSYARGIAVLRSIAAERGCRSPLKKRRI